MTISKDRVKPSPLPDSWKLSEIFTTGVVLGSYLAMMTVIFFWAAYKTDFFPVCLLQLQSQSTFGHISECILASMHVALSLIAAMPRTHYFNDLMFLIICQCLCMPSWILHLAFVCFGMSTDLSCLILFSASFWGLVS